MEMNPEIFCVEETVPILFFWCSDDYCPHITVVLLYTVDFRCLF